MTVALESITEETSGIEATLLGQDLLLVQVLTVDSLKILFHIFSIFSLSNSSRLPKLNPYVRCCHASLINGESHRVSATWLQEGWLISIVIGCGVAEKLRVVVLVVKLCGEVGREAYDEQNTDTAATERVEGRLALICQLYWHTEEVTASYHLTKFI